MRFVLEQQMGLNPTEIIEVGRINKTLYLLNYIDDEEYRRGILTELNRGEGRHNSFVLSEKVMQGEPRPFNQLAC